MLNQKGQNTAEYAILIALVIGAVLAMQTYVKRGIQGRVHDEVVDMAKGTAELGTTQQYEPYYLDSSFTTDVTKDTRTKEGAAKSPTIGVDYKADETGSQTFKAPTN